MVGLWRIESVERGWMRYDCLDFCRAIIHPFQYHGAHVRLCVTHISLLF
jgi:hypothetical protein